MNCVREDLKSRITDSLVGEADAATRAEVETHLASCASCRDEHERMAHLLGALKEAPPWRAAGTPATALADEGEDRLSEFQRRRVENALKGGSPRAKARSATGFGPPTWFAMAASLAVIGLALFVSRLVPDQAGREANLAVEAPAPARSASSVHELPQAPEGPMLPLATPAPDAFTAAPATRMQPTPPQVKVDPEALREFQRPIESEQARSVAQAKEEGAVSSLGASSELKKDASERRQDGAGAAAQTNQAPPPPPGLQQQGARPYPVQDEIQKLRKELSEQPPTSLNPTADELRLELREADLRRDKALRLRELEAQERAEPKAAAAPRDMIFESKGTNPFIVTEEDPQATFGLDVDTASYTLARSYLGRGLLPPPAAIRVEEFVNAFPNNVAPPRGDDSAFAVRVDGAPNPLHPGYHVIRVAVRAKEVDPRDRKAARLTFVIDVSGSMAASNRLELVKRSLTLLLDKLDERDTIGIVVYGTTARRVLAPTSAANRERILEALLRLRPEGSTNLQAGLDIGYEMAMEAFSRGASNRVVLCTDGVANTGETEASNLLARIRNEAKRGVDMMALGFGMGNYNDALLQRLADEGNGQYAYIDDIGEARQFFLRRLTSVIEVVARDAKAQIEFNPSRVDRYRLLGYEKRDIADRDFRNDAVDAGEINSGHSVTALFEVKLREGGSGRIGVARLRYKTSPRSDAVEVARNIDDEEIARRFDQASPAFQTAYVASRLAEHLRKSYWVKDEPVASVVTLAERLPESPQANELADLVRRAARLERPARREDW